ncbi:MAG: MAPEG family protein [Betaproteobacteria bacterium]|nr:MAPEG family protein [Betaproteobacteria bacterium]
MSTLPIPITAIFTGLLALMLVGISIRVTILRAKKKIDFFDGGDPELGRAIRVQGNFVEYVPLALALIGLNEWMGAAPWIVYTLGLALVAARIVHALGLYSNVFQARVIGTSVTWLVLVAGGLVVLGRVV